MFKLLASPTGVQISTTYYYNFFFIIVITIILQTANPNWENLMPKSREEHPVRKEKIIERIKRKQNQTTIIKNLVKPRLKKKSTKYNKISEN